MRIAFYMAAAFVAALGVSANAAYENLPPVGCIVMKTERLPRADLLEIVRAGFAPTSKSGKTTMAVVGQVVQGCGRTYGWGKPRENAAVQYFAMHVLHDDALEQGKRFGLTEAMSAGYVAGLTPEAKLLYSSGKVTPELNRAAFVYLQSAGIKVDGLKTEEVQALGQAFNMAVYSAVGQADAEKAYAGK